MKNDNRKTNLIQKIFSGLFSSFSSVSSADSPLSPDGGSHANEDRSQVILDASPLSCVFWDESGTPIKCNVAACKLLGYTDKEEFARRFMTLSPEFQPNGRKSLEFAREKMSEAFHKGQSTFEWLHRNVDGEEIPTEISLVRVVYEGRNIVIGHAKDLRELKKTENERDRERLLLRNILDSSPVCFAIIVGREVKFTTPFIAEFLGIRVGDQFRDYIAEEKFVQQLRDELDRNRIINWLPITLRTKDGDRKEMLANMFFLDYYGTEAVMVWLIDVTQIRKAEAELRLARDAAEASAKAKSEFLANMSHEIRTPMNAILGMAHLALRTELTPKQTEYIEGAEQSAKLLLRIINDILDFSKIEAGRMVMEYHEFALEDIIADLKSVVGEAAKKNGISLTFDLQNGIPKNLMGDSVRLRQVLVNLTSNAIKFTNGGDVRVLVRLCEQDGLSVELGFSVEDTGIGMTPEQIRSLFKPFSQADTSTTRKYGGTGLGLAISKSIVEMMKGRISCQSQPDKGTVFAFTARFGLPLENDSIEDVSEIRTDALLLGDRRESLKIIRHYLELLKCKVVAQYENEAGLSGFLEENRLDEVDFIIFDFDELVGKGLPMYRLLRDRCDGKLPQIAVAGHSEIDYVLNEMALSRPAQVIQEPIVVSELFNIMMSVTAEKKEMMHQRRARGNDAERTLVSYDVPEPLRGARILLAEDNRINQIVASEMLRMEGFDVDIAGTGREAVEMIKNKDYDLVLMDIQMPEMDGLAATRIVRSDHRFDRLPILAMTAHAMTGDRELSLEAGMNDHITKPIDPKLLFGALTKWIKR